ncbi:hypothetical protein Moror_11567 [Moniliophthora roreri MCA 2997]|uniref:Uncharacterized protein n=1 Tax=Moniliophthora roreri (strain MCA 2997) TaxID=1381753 RepID=V2W4K7_MONRO|nr:hypothetical protein Moror_11567 [Moniliophthora roreri MCA 2997]
MSTKTLSSNKLALSVHNDNAPATSVSKGKEKGRAILDPSDSNIIIKDVYNTTKIPAYSIQGTSSPKNPNLWINLLNILVALRHSKMCLTLLLLLLSIVYMILI